MTKLSSVELLIFRLSISSGCLAMVFLLWRNQGEYQSTDQIAFTYAHYVGFLCDFYQWSMKDDAGELGEVKPVCRYQSTAF